MRLDEFHRGQQYFGRDVTARMGNRGKLFVDAGHEQIDVEAAAQTCERVDEAAVPREGNRVPGVRGHGRRLRVSVRVGEMRIVAGAQQTVQRLGTGPAASRKQEPRTAYQLGSLT